MTKRIGPSMSTEPGWMAVRRASPLLLGVATGAGRNDASMLLSFERPALAGHPHAHAADGAPQTASVRLRRSLKTAQ